MKSKKITYEELEESRRYWKGLAILYLVLSILFIVISFIASYILSNYREENTQLKEQLNGTYEFKDISCQSMINKTRANCEVKNGKIIITEIKNEEVDYHSSPKLFCEHYNGTYDEAFFECSFYIDDVKKDCDISYDSVKNKGQKRYKYYYFTKNCEVISK